MRTTIRKWGNSAALRLPTPMLKALDLGPDDAVTVRLESGKLIVERCSDAERRETRPQTGELLW